jgi:hypothetical protein
MSRHVFINSSMRKSPKIDALGDALGIGGPSALGHLLSLFHNVKMASEGVVLGTAIEIAEAARWEGDATEFRQALITSGWLKPVPGHVIYLHLVEHGELVRIEEA